jgi:hypothetical protein
MSDETKVDPGAIKASLEEPEVNADAAMIDQYEEQKINPALPGNPEPKRIYANQMDIDSDLFKLEIGSMKKNTGWNDKDPLIVNVEHCHFFRTFDSNGKKMDKCNHVGGHAHTVSVTLDPQGKFIGTCSPALNTKFDDKHIHPVTYLRSDKVNKRVVNKEATPFINKYESYK